MRERSRSEVQWSPKRLEQWVAALRSTFGQLALRSDPLLIVAAGVAAKVFYLDLLLGERRDMGPFLAASVICAVLATPLIRSAQGFGSVQLALRPTGFLVPLLTAFGVLISLAFVLKISAEFSRGWLVSWFVLCTLLLFFSRVLQTRLSQTLAEFGQPPSRVALVHAEPLKDELRAQLRSRYHPFAAAREFYVDARRNEATYLSTISSRLRRFTDVVICCDGFTMRELQHFLRALQDGPGNVYLISAETPPVLPLQRFAALGGGNLVVIRPPAASGLGRTLKRTLDLTASSLMLLVLAPLFALIAVAIRLDSPGPVFFFQRRRGLGGTIIKVAKFRTMRVMEDGAHVSQADVGDPRVTRIGRLLRRTSLDELPQLYNVLVGEMSLVGPRPHAVAHDDHYSSLIVDYGRRLRVKPGITGWAQVNGHRGPTPETRMMAERVRYDLEYIENWSIWFDLEVLLLTPLKGFVHKNAI